MQVVPILKKIKTLPGFLKIGKNLEILKNDFINSTRLTDRLNELTCEIPTDDKICISILQKNILDNKEAYQILVDERGITISSTTEAGAFYSFMTLKQLITNDYKIPFVDIEDAPDLKIRGVMLDISRAKVPNIDTIKNTIKLLAELKYNHLELYIEGFSFETKKYPQVLRDHNYLTMAEYQEIEKFADEYFIDLVPNENGFGHMQDWLKEEEFKELAEVETLFEMWGSKRTSSTLDVTNPKSIELVKSLYDELLPLSKSNYFNMNFDEPFELGHGKSKEYCEKVGIGNAFVNYYLELDKHVRKYNKTPMIWGDVLLKHPEAIKRLPEDTIFIDWGYNVDYPYHENLKMLHEMGVKFMSAPATSTWGVITSRYLEMITTIRNACRYTKEYQGEGMLLTDWGDLGHLQYLPYSYPGFIYGAMCSWNVDRSPEYLIKEYLEKIVGSVNANAILDLSTYTRLEGTYRSYGSKLFYAILHAEGAINEEEKLTFFLNKMPYSLLTKDEAYALELEFDAIEKRIKPTDDLVSNEILGSIKLLKILLQVNVMLKAYFDKQTYLDQLDDCIFRLTNYLDVHKTLWEARNKKEGYVLSARRLHQLIEILKKLKERGN